MQDHCVSVVQREHRGGVGIHVAQAVIGDEAELVVTNDGIVLNHRVRARTRVVLPSRQRQFFGDGVPPDDVLSLQNGDFKSSLGEIRSSDQGVMAAPTTTTSTVSSSNEDTAGSSGDG